MNYCISATLPFIYVIAIRQQAEKQSQGKRDCFGLWPRNDRN